MTATTLLEGVSIGLWVTAIWAIRYNYRHTPSIDWEPPLPSPPAELPTVLVVVPVRNEERNIGPCLESLGRSDYPRLSVRVVDDGSTDRTGEIVDRAARRDPRIHVMSAGDLPHGWLGKNHALWSGTLGAQEDWLLFIDADMRLAPSCISRAVGAATRLDVDLLTAVPAFVVVTFWETVVQPIIAHSITLWLNAAKINRHDRGRAAAIGPFLLFRRSTYELVGGHHRVRTEVAEDLRLAQAIKHAGKRLLFVRGTRLASLRMYDSFAAIVNGWSKNFHVALEGRFWIAPFAAAGFLVFYGAPPLLPVIAWTQGDRLGVGVGVFAMVLVLGAWIHCGWLYGERTRQLCWGGVWAVLMGPLGAAVVAWILLRSVLRASLGKSSEWKGRHVQPTARKRLT